MASDNVISMMVEKGAPFTVDQLKGMSDKECWKWVYAFRPPKTRRSDAEKPEVCFTGFHPEEKARMEHAAQERGFRVVKSVTVKLKLLVTGDAPGSSKLSKAKEQGVSIMTAGAFLESPADPDH